MSLYRTKSLNTIPEKKIEEKIAAANQETDSKKKLLKLDLINKYVDSNIPLEYWNLKMERDFHGDPNLLGFYSSYIEDIKKSYSDGKGYVLAGNHGVGKSMTLCNIIKKSVAHGFTALYTTLSDIVSVLTIGPIDEKFCARSELIKVDFLVIDEWDNRFMANDTAADLYARILESVIRTRAQNKMPTLFATNSPNIIQAFNGALKDALSSIKNGYMIQVPVFGEDYRGKNGK